jgi:hypothetical protein
VSTNAIVWWATLVALIVVLGLAGVQAARALRELNRLKERAASYEDLPVLKALANAEARIQRLQDVADEAAPLVERAQAALAVIRRGPVPPDLIAAAERLRAEIVALRTFASR